MARPLRIEFAGGLYHITSRGDRREVIYEDDEDHETFLDVLAEVVEVGVLASLRFMGVVWAAEKGGGH